MADNINATAGDGTIIFATDDVGGAQYPRVKMIWGADGAVNDTSAAAPMPVVQTGTHTVVLGAGTAAYGKLSANSGIDIGDVDVTTVVPGTGATQLGKANDAVAGSTDTGVAQMNIRDDQLATLSAAEGDYVNSRATSKGALWVAIADSSGDPITSFGGGTQYTEDAAAAADPVGNAMIMVRKDTLAGITSADGDNVAARGTDKGELYVKHVDAIPVTDNSGSLTVDNGGTFAVQATVAAGATNIAKAEDVASADADVGVPAMAVRKATPANTSGTDGDYEFLQMSAGRLWASATVDAALPAGTNLIGDVALNGRATGSTVAITRFVSGASTNLTAVKSSAGTLYGFSISNVKSSAVFVRFYNTASGSVTVGTTTVTAGPFIGPGATTGAGHSYAFPLGIPFSNAGWSVSITAGSLADNDTTATAASDCAITIFYV